MRIYNDKYWANIFLCKIHQKRQNRLVLVRRNWRENGQDIKNKLAHSIRKADGKVRLKLSFSYNSSHACPTLAFELLRQWTIYLFLIGPIKKNLHAEHQNYSANCSFCSSNTNRSVDSKRRLLTCSKLHLLCSQVLPPSEQKLPWRLNCMWQKSF